MFYTVVWLYHQAHCSHTYAGEILADVIREYCRKLKIDDGLKSLGYDSSDIPALVEATIPQERVTKLAPREKTREDLASILEGSLTMY